MVFTNIYLLLIFGSIGNLIFISRICICHSFLGYGDRIFGGNGGFAPNNRGSLESGAGVVTPPAKDQFPTPVPLPIPNTDITDGPKDAVNLNLATPHNDKVGSSAEMVSSTIPPPIKSVSTDADDNGTCEIPDFLKI